MVVPSVIDSSLLLIDQACLSAWTEMTRTLALTTNSRSVSFYIRDSSALQCQLMVLNSRTKPSQFFQKQLRTELEWMNKIR